MFVFFYPSLHAGGPYVEKLRNKANSFCLNHLVFMATCVTCERIMALEIDFYLLWKYGSRKDTSLSNFDSLNAFILIFKRVLTEDRISKKHVKMKSLERDGGFT
jgi:hypothetical protein